MKSYLFSDNAACIISANTGVYSAVAKPLIDNYTIDWRFKYDFITQEKSDKCYKRSFGKCISNFEDKNRVMSYHKISTVVLQEMQTAIIMTLTVHMMS